MTKLNFSYSEQEYFLDLTPTGKTYTVTLNGESFSVEIIRSENGHIDLRSIRLSDSSSVRASALISTDGAKRWVTVGGQTFVLTKPVGRAKQGSYSGHTPDELLAPIAGLVRTMQVVEGDSVTKGQTLVIIEAMKMEIKIASPIDGTVKSIMVRQDQTVERDQILVEMVSSK